MCTFVTDMEKIILGIDPGTNLMGYGLLKVVDGKAQMITMGVIDLRKFPDAYMKLGHIFERVTGIIDGYLPDEMAIEAPFFGKNVQSMLKLGRAQGTAIAAAIHHGVPIHEYAPMKIKMALTGTGSASKEQVAGRFPMRRWENLWMQRMHWQQPIVTTCRWDDLRVRQSIVVGRTSSARIQEK